VSAPTIHATKTKTTAATITPTIITPQKPTAKIAIATVTPTITTTQETKIKTVAIAIIVIIVIIILACAIEIAIVVSGNIQRIGTREQIGQIERVVSRHYSIELREQPPRGVHA